jgi:hypothetical protein
MARRKVGRLLARKARGNQRKRVRSTDTPGDQSPKLQDAKARVEAALAAGDVNATITALVDLGLRRFTEPTCRFFEGIYGVDPNPLYAWLTYRGYRAMGDGPPAWVLAYFDRVAMNLLALTEAAKRDEEIKHGAVTVALELKAPGKTGRGTAFTNFPKGPLFEWGFIAAEVGELVRQGSQETYAIDAVAKSRGVSRSKVRLAYKKTQIPIS